MAEGVTMEIQSILFAAIGGILPAMLWVWFWNREDKLHPEPKRLIILTFLAGMVTVALVIPMQKMALSLLVHTNLVVLAWAAIEEVAKFAVAYFVVLGRREVDEPIDFIIYMLTLALGFAAAENTLFLIDPISNSGVLDSVLTGNFRFLGATLLHVLTSSVIGVAMAFVFYRDKITKMFAATAGVILAVTLHGLFNFFILSSESGNLLHVFAFVWIGLIFLLLAFEKVKRLRKYN